MIKTLIATAIAGMFLVSGPESGLNVGDQVTPFHPQHVNGPHKGTDACPP